MKQNLFIIGPVAAGKNGLLNRLKDKYNLNILDTGKLFRFLALSIYEKADIKPNIERLHKKDKQEEDRIIQGIYNRNRTLIQALNNLQIRDGKLFLNDQEIDERELYIRCLRRSYREKFK